MNCWSYDDYVKKHLNPSLRPKSKKACSDSSSTKRSAIDASVTVPRRWTILTDVPCHAIEPLLVNGHECRAYVKIRSPSPAMVKKEKKTQTNKRSKNRRATMYYFKVSWNWPKLGYFSLLSHYCTKARPDKQSQGLLVCSFFKLIYM